MTDQITIIRQLCADGTEGHGDEFYGPILEQAELMNSTHSEAFRHGVSVAVQLMVDDLGQLAHRRQQMHAREDTTAAMVGVARRLALLPMPTTPEDAPFTRGSVLLDVSGFDEAAILRAAHALHDAEEQIRQVLLASMPEAARRSFDLINPALPSWQEMDDISRDRFLLRARRALAAAILPL